MNKNFTIKLFLLFVLAVTHCELYAQTFQPKVGKDGLTFQEREVNNEKKRAEIEQNRLENKPERLKSEYGFTDVEVTRFMQLRSAHNAKIKAIKQSDNLSKDEKTKRNQNLTAKHHEQLKSILTASQYEIFQRKYLQSQETMRNNVKISELKRAYQKEVREVYELPELQREQKRTELKERYVAELSSYLSLEDAQEEIQLAYYQILVNKQGGREQELSRRELMAAGKTLDKNQLRKENITKLDISDVAILRRQRNVQKHNKLQLANVLDEDATEAMTARHNTKTHRQHYDSKYNFTDENYEKLIAIENDYAVQYLAIKKSAISIEEKQEAVKRIYVQKIKALKQLIPVDQRDEWLRNYRVNNRATIVKKKNKNNQPKA